MKQEMIGWQWHQLDHMQIICTSSRQIPMPAPHQSIFYRPDALPDAQPAVSEHSRQLSKMQHYDKQRQWEDDQPVCEWGSWVQFGRCWSCEVECCLVHAAVTNYKPVTLEHKTPRSTLIHKRTVLLKVATHYPCTAREHGRHFWRSLNMGHRHRHALLLVTSFYFQDACNSTGYQHGPLTGRVHGCPQWRRAVFTAWTLPWTRVLCADLKSKISHNFKQIF